MASPNFPGPNINRLIDQDPQIIKVPMDNMGWGSRPSAMPKGTENNPSEGIIAYGWTTAALLVKTLEAAKSLDRASVMESARHLQDVAGAVHEEHPARPRVLRVRGGVEEVAAEEGR